MTGEVIQARNADARSQPLNSNASSTSPPCSLLSLQTPKKGGTGPDLPSLLSPFSDGEVRWGGGTYTPIFRRGRTCRRVALWQFGSSCDHAGMLESELWLTCSCELHSGVKTTPSIFQNSKYRWFLSTSIILTWSHECVAVAVVFKWGEDAFAPRPLFGLLLPRTNVAIKLPSPGNSSLNGKCWQLLTWTVYMALIEYLK